MQHVQKSGQLLSPAQIQQLNTIRDVIGDLKGWRIWLVLLGAFVMGVVALALIPEMKTTTYLLSLLGMGFWQGYMQQMGRALCSEETEQSLLMIDVDNAPGKTMSIRHARERVRYQEMTFAEAMLILSSVCLIGVIAVSEATTLTSALSLWALGILLVAMLVFHGIFYCHRASFRLWMMMRKQRGAACPQ